MSKFKIGDRVRDVSPHGPGLGHGAGTIVGREHDTWVIDWDATPYGRINWHDDQIEHLTQPLTIIEGRYYKTRDGRKVGPARRQREWFLFGDYSYCPDGKRMALSAEVSETSGDTIIAEWQDGPVVTETVKRIVPGVYGRVRVGAENYDGQHVGNGIGLSFVTRDGGPVNMGNAALNAPELRAAAAVLTQLADALEEMK
jgi:hypothetical protein